MNKTVVGGLVGAAVVLVVAAVWIISSQRDPAETIGLEDFEALPGSADVLVDVTLPCRPSGRSGFLFRDISLRVEGQEQPAQVLSLWLLGQGLTIDDSTRSGAVRFTDGDRAAEVWAFEDYQQDARPKSQAVLSTTERPAVVLRVWPETDCEV